MPFNLSFQIVDQISQISLFLVTLVDVGHIREVELAKLIQILIFKQLVFLTFAFALLLSKQALTACSVW